MKQGNPSPATSSEFTPAQYSEAYGPGVERIYWHLSRNRIILSFLRRLPPGRVLDVGCGRGILVDYLVRAGVDCYGVELGDPPVPEHLRERLICGTASSALPADFRASVGVIVLGDVIEHLQDPPSFLKTLLADFPAAHSFVVTVPARSELWSNYDEHYGHYRRYDLHSLEAELASAGIGTVESSYMFRILYPLTRLALAFLGKRETRVTAPRRPLIHRLAAALLYADFTLLPAPVYGTSVICSGRRPLQSK
jgi:2-polyprenyl-3-methyl-5-hydroxy-6-metoxy-1,4-benzoquinol methylase